MSSRDLDKAALRGEPSYVWRTGQDRRLEMVLEAIGHHLGGRWLENGCGVGMYLQHLEPLVGSIVGLEFDYERAQVSHQHSQNVVNAAGEHLPLASASFDAILSHEVLEHVNDDRLYLEEMVRALRPGGLILLFVPNKGYPFETHGVYWRGRYHFGNIPLVHYLPLGLRQQLTPHVRAYSTSDLKNLFSDLPVEIVQSKIIFGAYDNIIQRYPRGGKLLRGTLQWLENTPLAWFGLSHFWVIRKN